MTTNFENFYEVYMVPVYKKDLAAVWEILAGRNSAVAEVLGGVSSGAVAATVAGFTWNEQLLRSLAEMLRPVQLALITCIAKAGIEGKAATFEELKVAGLEATGNPEFSFDKVRGNLAWITKYAVKLTGQAVWPFEFKDGGAVKPSGERYEYRMPVSLSELWLKIVGES